MGSSGSGWSGKGIGRLNADGTVDLAFNPGLGPLNALVISLALQADGKILIGGFFTSSGGHTRNGIARLNANGTVDSVFNPGVNGYVIALEGRREDSGWGRIHRARGAAVQQHWPAE